MFEKFLWWINGYLLVKISGRQPERFLNVCCYNNIFFQKVNYSGDSLTAYCRVKDLRPLKKHLRKADTRLRILKKKGLPFKLLWLQKQKALIVSIVLFIGIVFILSLRIWHIEISGGFVHTPEQIISFLEDMDVKYGMAASDVDCSFIEASIRKEYNDISWVSCERRGTNLIIQLKEAVGYGEEGALSGEAPEFGHIVAENDGIITEIITRRGTPLVEQGDIVKKGDILVSGIVDVIADNNLVVNSHPVLADADIKYKTLIKYEDRVPINYTVKEYTGNRKFDFDLNIFGVKIFAYYHRKLYNEYDIIKNTVSWKILNEFYLPVSHNIYEISEYISHEMVYSADEVRQEADRRLLLNLERLSGSGAVILNYKIDGRIVSDNYIYSGYIVIIEDAGVYREITEEELASALEKVQNNVDTPE